MKMSVFSMKKMEYSWNFWPFVAVLGLSMVALSSILAQFIIEPLVSFSANSQSILYIGEVLAKIVMIALGVLVLFTFVKGSKREASGFIRTNIWKIIIWGVISALIFNVFMYIWGLIVPKESMELALKSIGFGKTIFGDIAAVVIFTILAPIGEEIVFRAVAFGSVFSGLARHKKIGIGLAIIIAAVGTSFLFANIHLGEGKALYFMVPYFVISLVFTYVYVATGSLYTAIISHSVNNSFVVFMTLIGLKTITPTTNFVYVVVILGPFLAFGASYLIEKIFFNSQVATQEIVCSNK